MGLRLKNIFWNVLMVALVAVGLSACQKSQSDAEDLETWIVKTYFLPDDNPATIESSFKLCGTTNEIAIDNLALIYKSKDLYKTVDELVSAGIEGNCSNCNDDPRYNPIMEKSEKWGDEIGSGKMNAAKLAYDYAFFQHWLYLKYTEKITKERIRALYKDAKSKTPGPCLTSRMPKGVKPEQRPDNQGVTSKSKPKNKVGKGKEGGSNNEDSNDMWFLLASILLFLIEWKRGFIDIRRARRCIFGQINKTGSPTYQTPVTTANSASSREKEHQSGIYTQQQSNAQAKTVNDLYAPKENIPPATTPPEPQKDISPEKHVVISPPSVEKESNKETPTIKPLPEAKKEVVQGKPVLIPPLEVKKPELAPKEEVHSNAVIFARIPSGNLFFGFSPQPEYPDTPFIIDERTGAFDLVKDPQTLERLFSMIDQLKDACELMNINQPSLSTYEVKTKGQVVKEGDYWRIEKKLKLDW